MIFRYIWAFFLLFSLNAENSSQNVEEHLLLVTGCGRSGTTYISKFFLANDLLIGHEKLLKDGISSWCCAVDHYYSPWGPSTKNYRFQHVFHQVRNPLDVISSWYFNKMLSKQTWNYIFEILPEIRTSDTFLVQCAKYWYYWNLKAEEKATYRYQVENLENVIEEMSNILGVELNKESICFFGKNTNRRKDYQQRISWKELKEGLDPIDFIKLQSLAEKYSYPTTDSL